MNLHGTGLDKGELSLKIFGDEDENDEVKSFKAIGLPDKDIWPIIT